MRTTLDPRAAARAAVLQIQNDARAAGQSARSLRVRLQAETAARAILESAPTAARFQWSRDRKTNSVGTFFAVSACKPTAICSQICYVLANMASGPNSPAAVVNAVSNTLAAAADPDACARRLVAYARRTGASIRLNNGGEAPAAFVAAVARLVPTRVQFSVDASTPPAILARVGADVPTACTYTGTSATGDTLANRAHVVFIAHGPGVSHVRPAVPCFTCRAAGVPLAGNPCGRSCFRCYPAGARPTDTVAWGFTKRLDVINAVSGINR